ncbi:MAG: 3-keto-5-aminohexanoate cleavage protein [Rhodobacterales bacterium]|nr:3-keto-5-aminohexanoate cleavage protein [Rhodobacterales bacterium]
MLGVAPNGARRTKADHPALPMTPAEVARAAAACRDAGAALLHLHVRDAQGRHTLDVEAYRDATAAVRRAVGDGLIVQVTSESVGRYGPDEQMAMVRALKPEAVSLAVSELIPDPSHESRAAGFLHWLAGEAILPQYILYTPDQVAGFVDLRRRGIIPGDRVFVLYVLGKYAADGRSRPADLLPYLATPDSRREHWALCAFGPREQACAITAAALGGHARVGFENNLYLADGSPAPDNAALVAQVAAGVRGLGRPLADAHAARALLSAPVSAPRSVPA